MRRVTVLALRAVKRDDVFQCHAPSSKFVEPTSSEAYAIAIERYIYDVVRLRDPCAHRLQVADDGFAVTVSGAKNISPADVGAPRHMDQAAGGFAGIEREVLIGIEPLAGLHPHLIGK